MLSLRMVLFRRYDLVRPSQTLEKYLHETSPTSPDKIVNEVAREVMYFPGLLNKQHRA